MIGSLILALALQTPPTEPAVESAEDVTIPNPASATADETTSQSTPAYITDVVKMPAPEPKANVIPRDTPVHLMVLNEVSTKDHEPGHKFKLRVNKPIVVAGKELIPVGTTAWGELLDASSSGNVGKSGKLSAKLLYIDLDGQEIAIEGTTEAKGKSGTGETVLGLIALGPLALFAKGNNAKIKAGEMMTAFVVDNVTLNDAE